MHIKRSVLAIALAGVVLLTPGTFTGAASAAETSNGAAVSMADGAPSFIEIRLPEPYFYARPNVPFTISGILHYVPAGSLLTVSRSIGGSPETEIARLTADESRLFSFTDTLLQEGRVTYRVTSYDDRGYPKATAAVDVVCDRALPWLRLERPTAYQAYGTPITLTARLGKTDTNRVVEIWADPYGGDQPNRLLRKGAVDSTGKLTATLKVTRNTVVSVRYAGDAVYAPISYQHTVYTRVATSTKVSRHYKTTKVKGNTWYHVRTSRDPRFTITMSPYPDRFCRIVIQRYKNGKWRAFDVTSASLNRSGRSIMDLTGSYPAGSKFRVRAEYGTSPYTDKINAKTIGAWTYFTYTK